MPAAPSPVRPRPARQPSRLSVVSSALSSAGSEDEELDTPEPDAEGEVDDELDDLSEDEVDGGSQDEDEDDESYADDSRASSIMPKSKAGARNTKAPAKGKASSSKQGESSKSPLKITLKGRAPPAKAAAASSRPSRAVVQNNRGKKIIESDEDDEDEDEDDQEDADGDADMTPGVGEDEDEEMDELGDVSAPGLDSEVLDADGEEDDESMLLNNLPKTARQLAKAGFGEELMELPMSDDSRKLKRTAAEIALKRSETARRRRYQSEKKLDDEKTETINRLLKKQVGRKSTRELKRDNAARAKRAKDGEGEGEGDVDEEEEEDESEEAQRSRKQAGELTRAQEKDLPAPFFRTVIRADRTLVSVPVLQSGGGDAAAAQGEDQGPYMRRWTATFGVGSAKIQVIEGSADARSDTKAEQPQVQSAAADQAVAQAVPLQAAS